MKKFFLFAFLGFLISCSSTQTRFTPEEIQNESAKANVFFEKVFDEATERSPEFLTFLGSKKKYDQLDDTSYENFLKEVEIAKDSYQELKKIDRRKLDEVSQISYDLFERDIEELEEQKKFYYHKYLLNQLYGRHTELIDFMLYEHSVINEPEAWSYISRLQNFEKTLDELLEKLKVQNKIGVTYPSFVFDHLIRDCKNIVSGFPFDKVKKDSTLYKDFRTKVARLKVKSKTKNLLMNRAKVSLKRNVKPGYLKLIAYLEKLQKEQTEVKGVWALPKGKEFYAYRIRKITTTDLNPQDIHKLGLSEVKRIQAEIQQVAEELKFDGSLNDFFESVKVNKELYYPNTYWGRKNYLKDTKKIIDDISARIDELFNTKPKAELKVLAVEKFRQKSAGVAFYERPAPDGSRPGRYYVNLYDMSAVPKYSMEALAYHEAIPGHHMQLAIAQELVGLPKFRKFGFHNSYTEGWGLYSEGLPKEIGFYKDLYSDFGRLSMELWRAVRLVVDTGIHFYKWDKQKAVDYMMNNSDSSEEKTVKEIERYFMMPGQAVSYKIGQLKILELRQKAKQALKSSFDLKEFHDVILKNGPVTFTVLEQVVDSYIKTKLKTKS